MQNIPLQSSRKSFRFSVVHREQLTQKLLLIIVATYQFCTDIERYSRKVSIEEIEKNGYNLNISRYVSTSEVEIQIDLNKVNTKLTAVNERIKMPIKSFITKRNIFCF